MWRPEGQEAPGAHLEGQAAHVVQVPVCDGCAARNNHLPGELLVGTCGKLLDAELTHGFRKAAALGTPAHVECNLEPGTEKGRRPGCAPTASGRQAAPHRGKMMLVDWPARLSPSTTISSTTVDPLNEVARAGRALESISKSAPLGRDAGKMPILRLNPLSRYDLTARMDLKAGWLRRASITISQRRRAA